MTVREAQLTITAAEAIITEARRHLGTGGNSESRLSESQTRDAKAEEEAAIKVYESLGIPRKGAEAAARGREATR